MVSSTDCQVTKVFFKKMNFTFQLLENVGHGFSSYLTLCIQETPKLGTFANSVDPDKMQYDAAFRLILHRF